jgi:hypothetical protein
LRDGHGDEAIDTDKDQHGDGANKFAVAAAHGVLRFSRDLRRYRRIVMSCGAVLTGL